MEFTFEMQVLTAVSVVALALLYQFGEWIWIIFRQLYITLMYKNKFGYLEKNFITYKPRGFNWKADYFSQDGNLYYFVHNQLQDGNKTLYLGNEGEHPAFNIMDPEIIEVVMKDINLFPRGPTIQPLFEDVMGIPLPEGENWFKLKRMLLPMFYGQNLDSHTSKMDEKARNSMKNFASFGKETFSLQEPLSTFAMSVMLNLCFGDRFETGDVVQKFIDVFADVGTYMLMLDLSGREFTSFTGRYRAQQKKVKALREAVNEVVKKERELQEDLDHSKSLEAHDLVKSFLFVEQTKEDMSEWMREQLVNQIIMFLFAGMDTSGSMLQIVLHFLADNPEVLKKCRAEAEQVLPKDGDLTHEASENLKYCSAVVFESLRLNPGVFIDRQVTSEGGLSHGDLHFPEGSVLMFNTTAIMENEKYWGNDAHKFRPERWLDINEFTLNQNHFPMFGAKSKAQCPGQRFARQEMKIFVARFAYCFDIEEVLLDGKPYFCSNQGISKPAPHVKYRVNAVRDF